MENIKPLFWLKKRPLVIAVAVTALVIIAGTVTFLIAFPGSVMNWMVTVEAGSPHPPVTAFIKNKDARAAFLSDMSTFDMRVPGIHWVRYSVNGREYSSIFRVEDSIPPVVSAKELQSWQGDVVHAGDFITSIKDNTDVEVYYRSTPDFDKPGIHQVELVAKDLGGNKTIVKAQLIVKKDSDPPVILGAINQIVFVEDRVSYRKGVYVVDNRDKKLNFSVDSSKVNLAKPGKYPVVYTAEDSSKNKGRVTVELEVQKKPKDYVSPEIINAIADKILKRIIRKDMSQKQKAKAIYIWAKRNIGFSAKHTSTDLKRGAFLGLKRKQGDCYIYYASSRILLSRAGIDNIEVLKWDGGHYWNMVKIQGNWYHFDTTPRFGGGEFFLLTDQQLAAYSKRHHFSHRFVKKKYPQTPKKNIKGNLY